MTLQTDDTSVVSGFAVRRIARACVGLIDAVLRAAKYQLGSVVGRPLSSPHAAAIVVLFVQNTAESESSLSQRVRI